MTNLTEEEFEHAAAAAVKVLHVTKRDKPKKTLVQPAGTWRGLKSKDASQFPIHTQMDMP